jgi:hypothetical protein
MRMPKADLFEKGWATDKNDGQCGGKGLILMANILLDPLN